VTSSDLGEF